MKRALEKRQERAKLIKQAREVLDLAENEKRDLSAEERTKYDKIMGDVDALGESIGRLERQEKLEDDLERSLDGPSKLDPQDIDVKGGQRKKSVLESEEYREAFWGYVRGLRPLNDVRSLHMHTDSNKGITLVPTEFEKQLINELTNYSIMRTLATVSASSNDKTIPMVNNRGTASWIDEEGTYPDSDDEFGSISMAAYKVGRIVKVSEELLADSAFNLETYIRDSLAESLGEAEEAAFVNGDGEKKPTGFLKDAEVGLTAASGTAIVPDELLDLFYSLKRKYRAKAKFLANDSTILAIRKLKDSQGNYIWQPGLQAGQPDRLLNKPILTSEDMPEIGIGANALAFGDFRKYSILDRVGIYIQKLVEIYAEKGQIGFKAYRRTEGKLLVPAAVKVLKMAAV